MAVVGTVEHGDDGLANVTATYGDGTGCRTADDRQERRMSALVAWLTTLRVLTGATFVYMGTTHALGGWASPDTFQQMMSRMAGGSPFGWYTALMGPIISAGAAVIGPLFVYGMIAAGLGVALGAFTRVAIVAGLWLNLNALLLGFGGGGVHHALNLLMMTVQIAVWHTGAWRVASVDGLLARWSSAGRR